MPHTYYSEQTSRDFFINRAMDDSLKILRLGILSLIEIDIERIFAIAPIFDFVRKF